MSSAWLLPEHIADVLPAQARRLEELRRVWLDVARGYGFELVMPPLLEHLDSLLSGTGHALDLRTFKLVDQLSGRSLGVRADATPQAARTDRRLGQEGRRRPAAAGSAGAPGLFKPGRGRAGGPHAPLWRRIRAVARPRGAACARAGHVGPGRLGVAGGAPAGRAPRGTGRLRLVGPQWLLLLQRYPLRGLWHGSPRCPGPWRPLRRGGRRLRTPPSRRWLQSGPQGPGRCPGRSPDRHHAHGHPRALG